ncbi:MAG: tetratricopeptide repeat protein [Nitrospirota bacterium]
MGRGIAGREVTGKKIIRVLLVSILLLFIITGSAYAVNIKPGEDAPDFILKSVEEKIFSLSDFKDKITVFIYWRPDQQRSHMALQDGQYIAETFNDRDVQVLGFIARHDNMDEILKIIKDSKVGFPVLKDSYRDVYSDYGIRVYPTTIIVDKYGKVAYSIPGHALTYKISLEAHLKYMLGEITGDELKEMMSPRKEKEDESVLKAERTYNLALKFTEAGLFDKAADAAQQSIEERQDNAKSYILLGSLMLQQEKADQAIENFTRALEIKPFSHNAKTGLGSSLLLKGDLDRAIEVLEDAAVANPYPAMTWFELGKAYELKGEKDKSLELYRKALGKMFKNKILSLSGSR